ncbi:hypothetical protein CSQ80_10020 [Cyanobacterium aponinum IPPAS B-1201]|nr:hypothetical protein CSQ80_10020 [Cyanobacterium aponinum IPPAS B-1201]
MKTLGVQKEVSGFRFQIADVFYYLLSIINYKPFTFALPLERQGFFKVRAKLSCPHPQPLSHSRGERFFLIID